MSKNRFRQKVKPIESSDKPYYKDLKHTKNQSFAGNLAVTTTLFTFV